MLKRLFKSLYEHDQWGGIALMSRGYALVTLPQNIPTAISQLLSVTF